MATCNECGKEFKNVAAHARLKHPPEVAAPATEVAVEAPMPVAPKATLKRLPGFTMGVRENSAVRMVKLASPICPYSKQEMDRTPDGRWIPSRNPSGVANCQLAGGRWWIDCEARGHDPYYHTTTRYIQKDEWAEDEDGNQILTGQKTIRREEREPNFIQCPVGLRYGGAQDPVFKLRRSMERKGRKRLSEIGYEEVCQFRNCQEPVNRRYRSNRVGDYCSLAHLQLISADWNNIKLVQLTGRFELGQESELRQKRESQLREAAAFALDPVGRDD